MNNISWLSSVGPSTSASLGGGGFSMGATAFPDAHKPANGAYSFGATPPSFSSTTPGVEPVLLPVGTGDAPPATAAATSGGVVPGAVPAASSSPGGSFFNAEARANASSPGAGTGAGPIPTKNSMSGGGSVGGQLADSIKAIGDMISNYQMAGAYGSQEVAAQAPQGMITPALANFSVPTIARRV